MMVGVIGGSGFIGSHVVDQLLAAGHDVTVFDIMTPHRADVRHIAMDMTDLSKAAVALAGGYDAVYMLAAMANVNDVYRNPVESVQVNIQGVVNVLEACRRSGVGRFILASTVWVYEAAEEDCPDEDSALRPGRVQHLYTAAKIMAEMACHSYLKLYDQDFTILRYGIPYGPRAREGTVIATFVRRALRGEPLVVQGTGAQSRSFIYVEDLAAGNVAALQPVAANRTYNLEGPRPVTIREVAETVRRLVGNVETQYVEARPGDYAAKLVTSRRAETELGWRPGTELEEGVCRYIEWLKGAACAADGEGRPDR
jgi:UDP-glucose 4-epimerase